MEEVRRPDWYSSIMEEVNNRNKNHVVKDVNRLRQQIGFVRHKAGYECMEALTDKAMYGATDKEIAAKYEVKLEEVHQMLDSAYETLSRYNIIGELGYDECEEKNVLPAEFLEYINVGKRRAKVLSSFGMYSPIQWMNTSNECLEEIFGVKFTDDVNKKIEMSGFIDNGLGAGDFVKRKEKTITETLDDMVSEYVGKLLTYEEYADLFDSINALYGDGPILRSGRIQKSSNKLLMPIGLKVKKVDETGLYEIYETEERKAEMVKCKKKTKSNSVEIASKREKYPYGILYGAFTPKEQDTFPAKYAKNADALIEHLSSTDKDVRAMLENGKNGWSYDKIKKQFYGSDFDIDAIRNRVFETIHEHKAAIINGIPKEKAPVNENEYGPYVLNPMTVKVLRSCGIKNMEKIDACMNLNELQGILNGAGDRKRVLISDLLESLNAQGYDTVRFGYYGKNAPVEHPSADVVATDKKESVTNNISSKERHEEAGKYLLGLKDVPMTAEELEIVMAKYTMLNRGFKSLEEAKKNQIKLASFDIYCNQVKLYRRKNAQGLYVLLDTEGLENYNREKIKAVKSKEVSKKNDVITSDKVESSDPVQESKEETTMSKREFIKMMKSQIAKELKEEKIEFAITVKGKCPECGAPVVVSVPYKVPEDGCLDIMDNIHITGAEFCDECLHKVVWRALVTFVRK